jgi:ATP-dependent helicase/nuclease subunit B
MILTYREGLNAMSTVSKTIPDPWPHLIDTACAWCTQQGLLLRDVQVLVPFAQHLPLARAAWVLQGGWMPRIETTQTLARALRPSAQAQPQQISFDVAADRLSAAALLNSTLAQSTWAQHDALGRAWAVEQVTATAHALARAAFALAPAQRSAYWTEARDLIRATFSPHWPGQVERLLAQVALEWAALAPEPSTDALFEHPVRGWVLIEAGGPDALARAVVSWAQMQDVPVLFLNTDVTDANGPQDLLPATARVQHRVCDDFETEAQCTAAQVLSHVQAGEVPVALVAQDRLLVRRVQALLGRQGLWISDETGWTLSTTRAATVLMSALNLAQAELRADDYLDALKSCASPLGQQSAALPEQAVRLLECTWRRCGWRTAQAVDTTRLPDTAKALWQRVQTQATEMDCARPRTLAQWQQSLRHLLQGLGVLQALQQDQAGCQITQRVFTSHSSSQLGNSLLDWADFTGWLDDVLEHTSFMPASPPRAQVVITPLAHLVLRPFAAVVCPGSDELSLGGWTQSQSLLGPALATRLGLPCAQQHRQAQWLAFCHVLHAPCLTLLSRKTDQGEHLGVSPFVRALSCLRHEGGPIEAAPEVRVALTLQAAPLEPPQPAAPAHLPKRLSASSCEALRQCPYRFFALYMLQLRADDELDQALAKRDYGTWLHEVLRRFHERRAQFGQGHAQQEAMHLFEIAQAVQAEQRLDGAEFLPYAATFARFVPRYLQWLQRRDAQGSLWLEGERTLTAAPEAWQGITMHGVIDRVDSEEAQQGPVIQLLDYKTGSSKALREKIKQPLEDTQLAFYAALMAQQSQSVGPISAAYVTLDDGDAIQTLVHPNVTHSAEQLLQGLSHDLQQLRQGAPLPALGQGAVCTTCQARGLCRRDEWSEA